jgi:phosphoglycolate phosphatase
MAAWAVPYGYNSGIPITAANPDRVFHSLPEMAEYVTALRAEANR